MENGAISFRIQDFGPEFRGQMSLKAGIYHEAKSDASSLGALLQGNMGGMGSRKP